MERRIRTRIGVLILVIGLLVGLFSLRVYKLQISEDARQADTLTYYTTVQAARGQILDRNGTVLVTNRASYDIVVISYVWLNGPSPNESLMKLLDTCDELGVSIQHHLPVSEDRPYRFTLDEYEGTGWDDHFRTYLNSRDMDSDIAAGTFMNNLRKSYNLPEDMSPEEAYRLIAVRYELELRGIEGMPLDNYVLASDVSAEQLAAITELGIPGVTVQISTVREYKTQYAAHILGYTGKMTAEEYNETYKDLGYAMNAVVGKEGVELAFEQYLHGTDGLLKTTITSTGQILDQEYVITPVPGGNVELSIDLNLQQTAYNALEAYILDIRENGANEKLNGMDAKGGAVVVQDVNTGEILAAASYPSYDPNTFSRDYNELLNDPYTPLINRCFNAQYPPGSTFKMITGITAMEFAGVNRYFQVVDEGVYTKFEGLGYAPACHIYRSRGVTHGTENMMEALRDSCNYYFYEVGLKCSIKDMDYVASKFGLGEYTGIEVLEYKGQRANRDSKAKVWAGTAQEAWVEGDMIQASIGQSLNEFTPLQLCVYTSTLANEGVRMKATLLRRVVSWDFKDLLAESQPEIADRIELKPETITMYKEGMVMATGLGATAEAFSKENYPIQVAAKTGTAQHGDLTESDNSSLVCFAPVDDPELAIAIYVENGAVGGRLSYIAMDVFDSYFSQTGRYDTVYGENEVR